MPHRRVHTMPSSPGPELVAAHYLRRRRPHDDGEVPKKWRQRALITAEGQSANPRTGVRR